MRIVLDKFLGIRKLYWTALILSTNNSNCGFRIGVPHKMHICKEEEEI